MDNRGARLERRLQALSQRICAALDAALRSALQSRTGLAVESLRPVLLTARLGLDKSLASRVVRAIQCEDPIRALYRIPTPQGLALVGRAAEEAGADEVRVMALMEASDAYGALLSEFSGGRTDLEATLAGWIPEERERAERDARRAVFRGMTTLSGARTSASYHSLYLVPSSVDRSGTGPSAGAGGEHVNSLAVTVQQDLRRLRPDARLRAMCLQDDGAGPPHRARDRFTLDGAPLADDPAALLLQELCSHPPPELQLQRTGSRIEVFVHPRALDVNEFATIGMGWKTEAHFARHAAPSRRHGSILITAPNPTEALVFDLFLHRDLGCPGAPYATLSDGVDPGPAGSRGPGACVDLSPDSHFGHPSQLTRSPLDLDAHPSGLASPDVRACGAIAENACREAGYRLADFSKYRFKLSFPTPAEALAVRWALSEP